MDSEISFRHHLGHSVKLLEEVSGSFRSPRILRITGSLIEGPFIELSSNSIQKVVLAVNFPEYETPFSSDPGVTEFFRPIAIESSAVQNVVAPPHFDPGSYTQVEALERTIETLYCLGERALEAFVEICCGSSQGRKQLDCSLKRRVFLINHIS